MLQGGQDLVLGDHGSFFDVDHFNPARLPRTNFGLSTRFNVTGATTTASAARPVSTVTLPVRTSTVVCISSETRARRVRRDAKPDCRAATPTPPAMTSSVTPASTHRIQNVVHRLGRDRSKRRQTSRVPIVEFDMPGVPVDWANRSRLPLRHAKQTDV